MDFLLLEQVDSTNSYVSHHAASLADMTMVIADAQTAGRGQRGNSWESEPGKNLTFTLLHRPKGRASSSQSARRPPLPWPIFWRRTASVPQ